MEAFIVDPMRVQKFVSEQCWTCHKCGERINCSKFKAVSDTCSFTTRPAQHGALSGRLLQEVKRRPQEYLALALRDLASNPAMLDRLQRDGVLVKVGKG